jgi:hypothetical protein
MLGHVAAPCRCAAATTAASIESTKGTAAAATAAAHPAAAGRIPEAGAGSRPVAAKQLVQLRLVHLLKCGQQVVR